MYRIRTTSEHQEIASEATGKQQGWGGEGEGKGSDGKRRGMTRNDELEVISTPSRNNCYNSTVQTPYPWENSKSE